VTRLGLPQSDDTLLRSLKRHAARRQETASVRVVGIDDWSLRQALEEGRIRHRVGGTQNQPRVTPVEIWFQMPASGRRERTLMSGACWPAAANSARQTSRHRLHKAAVHDDLILM
jgi:hypothetical protein